MSFKEVKKVDKNVKECWEAINQGLVPKGYKKTKVGIIPEDWEVKKLAEVADVISGGTPSTSIDEYWADDILWATPGDITSTGKYIYDTSRKISNLGLEKSSAKLLPENSILMTSRATIGECSINKLPMATNQGFKSFVCHSINYEYLYYNMKDLKKVFKSKASGSTFLEISKKDVDNTKIQIPTLEEQEKIADILSTWDKSIESYVKLLEEKKERKKGLMQMLLTGEKRLRGFTGPWKEVMLGEIFSIPKKYEVINPDINKIITVRLHRKGVFTGLQNETLSLGATKYYYRRSGQFIYGKQNIFNGAFGLVPKELDMCYSSSDIPSLDFKDGLVVPKYIDYYFSRKSIYRRLESRAIGTGSKRLHESEFLKLKIRIPEVEEQKAITKVLATADREIDLLDKLIEELEEEKKGLMQVLLTGIVRV